MGFTIVPSLSLSFSLSLPLYLSLSLSRHHNRYPMNKTQTDSTVATGRRDNLKGWFDRSIHGFTVHGKHIHKAPPLLPPDGAKSRKIQIYFETPKKQMKLRSAFIYARGPIGKDKMKGSAKQRFVRKLVHNLSKEVLKNNSYAADCVRAGRFQQAGTQIVVQADRGRRPKNYESRGMNEFAAVVRGEGGKRYMLRRSLKRARFGKKNAGQESSDDDGDDNQEKETAQEKADRLEYESGIDNNRDLFLSWNNTEWSVINSKHRSYDPMGYPLLGESDGFSINPLRTEDKIRVTTKGHFRRLPTSTTATTMREFYAHRFAVRPEPGDIARSSKLASATTEQVLRASGGGRGSMDGMDPHTTLAVDREAFLAQKIKKGKNVKKEDHDELKMLNKELTKMEGVAAATVDAELATDIDGDVVDRFSERRLSRNQRKKRRQKTKKRFVHKLAQNLQVLARGQYNITHRKRRKHPVQYNALHRAGPLFQQYTTDMGAKLLQSDLEYINKPGVQSKTLRADKYKGALAAAKKGKTKLAGRPVQAKVLPATFIGGPRHMRMCYRKAMAMVRKEGKPSLFITMTVRD